MFSSGNKGRLGWERSFFWLQGQVLWRQWDSQVFADSRGTGMVGPFSALSEWIAARVHVPPLALVPASTCAVSCPVGCHGPAPGSLQPRLFILADSAQHSCSPQLPYPHLLSGLPVFIRVPFLPQLPVFLPSASLPLQPLPHLTPLSNSLAQANAVPCPCWDYPQPLLMYFLLGTEDLPQATAHPGRSPPGMKCPTEGCHSSQHWGGPTSSLCPERKTWEEPIARKGIKMQPLRSCRARTPWSMNQQKFYLQCSYKVLLSMCHFGLVWMLFTWLRRGRFLKEHHPWQTSGATEQVFAPKNSLWKLLTWILLLLQKPSHYSWRWWDHLGWMWNPQPDTVNRCGEFGPKWLTFGRITTMQK